MATEDTAFDSLYAQFKLETALEDIDKALRLAEIRALPLNDVLARVPTLLNDERREEILIRLQEESLSDEDAVGLADHVRRLADEWDRLPSRAKARGDATLMRLLRALPDEQCYPLALQFVKHPRKARRSAVYKILRGRELPADMAAELTAVYETTGDDVLLELIARNPPLVARTDETYLLDNIREPYWQMRVVEALLRAEPARAVKVAHDWPRGFVHAVGRAVSREHLPLLRELLRANAEDPEFLGIYTWALGRVGDADAFEELRRTVAELRKKLSVTGA
jgi:hypothetical protein